MRQTLSTLLLGSLSLASLVGCAVDSNPTELHTVPSLEPIAIDVQRSRALTCPAGSTLCKTVCCPKGSYCTTIDDGTELCQVPPIDPTVMSATSAEKTSDAGTKQAFYELRLNDVFVSSY